MSIEPSDWCTAFLVASINQLKHDHVVAFAGRKQLATYPEESNCQKQHTSDQLLMKETTWIHWSTHSPRFHEFEEKCQHHVTQLQRKKREII